jgi:hypothetical protein
MKQLFIISALAIILLVVGFSEEKKYKVEFTQPEWEARYNWIEVAKSQLKASNLPAKDVLFISDSLLGRFQGELANQLRPQFLADTAKKKSK